MIKHCLCTVLVLMYCVSYCDGQVFSFRNYETASTEPPLPFPACRADNIECLRRGLRTFFFLMDSRHLGMTPVDPLILNSVAVSVPEEQMSFLLRKVNVTGARWTKLIDRKFHVNNGKNSVRFKSDLHVIGEMIMTLAGRSDPFVSLITIDINDVESNITYAWTGQRGYDNEDYILIGQERVAVRNTRTPSFFLQPTFNETNTDTEGGTQDSYMMERILLSKSAILDHLANEVTVALMHTVVDNFRLFANQIAVKNYYIYNS
ncbi:unnamed protein product [Leptosia nina]|uniref:Uncharacterized protein n=1 Tax=Leptosia nina TaxID=320188 RepID=A0AAV1K467_9NEOP